MVKGIQNSYDKFFWKVITCNVDSKMFDDVDSIEIRRTGCSGMHLCLTFDFRGLVTENLTLYFVTQPFNYGFRRTSANHLFSCHLQLREAMMFILTCFYIFWPSGKLNLEE